MRIAFAKSKSDAAAKLDGSFVQRARRLRPKPTQKAVRACSLPPPPFYPSLPLPLSPSPPLSLSLKGVDFSCQACIV